MLKKEETKNLRTNLEPDTIQDLQECLYAWQKYNFGEQDNERVLLGICEEAGELCHAQLKMEQGIRGSQESLEAEFVDAIGDIAIYMLNYVSGMGELIPAFSTSDDIAKIEDPAIIRKSVFAVYRTVAKLVEEPSMARIQHITNVLLWLCGIKGLNFESIIRDTWREVGKRDWKQFPKTGFPSVVAAASDATSDSVSAIESCA